MKVNQRLSGSSDAFADSGVTASCVNGAFTWTKSYTADTNYIATSLGSGFQYDFKIYGQDGVGAQITDPLALTAVKMFRLAPTVLANVKYVKSLVQQTLVVLGTNTTITDSADGDTGGTGHCPASSAPFVLGGSVDPESNVGISGASSLNSNSGTTLALTACVPFGSTSLVLYTKDESGSTLGSQYSVNVISNETITTFGFASQGFKMQNLSPQLNTLLSQGINLINVSSEHIGTASVNSSGTTGYTISVGLTNYTQQVSP